MTESQPARKRTADGLLFVDKKSGVTSHDVVDRFRRFSKIKKVGHTGTLDPLATGLLVLCVGKATRLQAYLMGMEKTYEGVIQFGWATDSFDSTGVPATDPVEVNVEGVDFEPLLARFRGVLDQMPPQFSAKKVAGVRAYELARKGEIAALTTKRVTVYEFEITAVSGSTAHFRVRSSAGTYVRSLAHDLGAAAGIPAHLKELRRTAIGAFDVAKSLPFDQIPELSFEELLAPPHFQTLGQVDLPLTSLRIDRSQETKLQRGQSIILSSAVPVAAGELVALGNLSDQLVAIGEIKNVMREGGACEIQPKVVLSGAD